MAATQRYKLGRTRRLSGRKAFARVFAGKCSASDALLVVYAAANGLDYSRLGLSVGRRHGTAVARNRLKRLIREAFRLEQGDLPRGYDLVCVPRAASEATLVKLRASLVDVSRRAVGRCRKSSSPDA